MIFIALMKQDKDLHLRSRLLAKNLSSLQKKKLPSIGPQRAFSGLSLGIEIFSGFLVAFILCWGIGKFFGLPPIARILLGMVLGAGANFLTVKKAMNR